MTEMNRRDWMMQVTALGVASSLSAHPASAQGPADTTKWFPGFKPFRVKTTGAEINGVIGGSGPPILLLHGAPQSHISWRLVAPKLAATRTVVATATAASLPTARCT
jgi:haloacetate dehalogenase